MAHELLHFKQANMMNRLGKNLAKTPDQIPILERQVEQKDTGTLNFLRWLACPRENEAGNWSGT